MKRIYQLLVLLMGILIFVFVYMLVKSEQFSNVPNPEAETTIEKSIKPTPDD